MNGGNESSKKGNNSRPWSQKHSGMELKRSFGVCPWGSPVKARIEDESWLKTDVNRRATNVDKTIVVVVFAANGLSRAKQSCQRVKSIKMILDLPRITTSTDD